MMVTEVLMGMLLASMQAPTVKNPSAVEFNCADHAQDTQHELDVVRVSDNAVIATLLLGDPAADANGLVRANINVQPIAFGQYVARVRAVVGTLKSDDSADSNTFERAPGKPTGIVVK